MEVPRRFLFRGNASGVAAHIRRPVDRVLGVQAASSLPVIGGISQSKVGPQKFLKYLSFDAAATSAAADFADAKQAEAITRGEAAPDEVPTQTTVSAVVKKILVLDRLSINLAAATITGRSPENGEQPPLICDGSRIEGVKVDNSKCKITLSNAFFTDNPTKDHLAAAFSKGLEPRHQALIRPAGKRSRNAKLPEANGLVYCTIVEKIEWDGKPHPNATIDGNALIIPAFGRVFFGELFVSDFSRRLTIVRIELGSLRRGSSVAGGSMTSRSMVARADGDGESPVGGEVAMAEAETNGTYWPVG